MLYQESEYTKVFDEADTDRDGYISYNDLRKLILDSDKTFPEQVIKVAFKEAKVRIPPADKMDLPEFMEAMGKLAAYKRGGWTLKGPILYSRLSSSLTQWLRTPRFARWLYEHFFHETDEDEDGFITYDEFLITLRKYELEYLANTVKLEFRKHNTRGDGFMSLVEFMIAMGFPPLGDEKQISPPVKVTPVKAAPGKNPKSPKFQLGASLLKQIFMSMDTDGNGVLNKDELRQVFVQLGQEMTETELDAMIKSNDKEGDGCLTFDEFINSVYPTVTEVKDNED